MTTNPLIIPERLAKLDQLTLDEGEHPSFEAGHCAMEVAAWLAGEGNTDSPACVSPVLAAFTIRANDGWDKSTRQRLKPYLPRMVGTAGDEQDKARSYLALDWLIRVHTAAWLDVAGLGVEAQGLRDLRPVVDISAAEAAGPVVRGVRDTAVAAGAAARDAARAAAGAAAGAAARDAARAAAGAAARAAARDAAWAAAGAAARAAARAAAGAAAGAAARDALQPTVDALQTSALDLLDRMIDPKKVTA